MIFVGVMQSLEEEKGFWDVLWDICPHIIKRVLNEQSSQSPLCPVQCKTKVLGKGNAGEDVKLIQNALAKCGFNTRLNCSLIHNQHVFDTELKVGIFEIFHVTLGFLPSSFSFQ